MVLQTAIDKDRSGSQIKLVQTQTKLTRHWAEYCRIFFGPLDQNGSIATEQRKNSCHFCPEDHTTFYEILMSTTFWE